MQETAKHSRVKVNISWCALIIEEEFFKRLILLRDEIQTRQTAELSDILNRVFHGVSSSVVVSLIAPYCEPKVKLV